LDEITRDQNGFGVGDDGGVGASADGFEDARGVWQ